jgi:hypothetical protein
MKKVLDFLKGAAPTIAVAAVVYLLMRKAEKRSATIQKLVE